MYALNLTFGSYYHKTHTVLLHLMTAVLYGLDSRLVFNAFMAKFTPFLCLNEGLDFKEKS